MAETQSCTSGVIRSTRDYLRVSASPASLSPAESEDIETSPISTLSGDDDSPTTSTSRDNPREIRNRAEKLRRDKLNQSISELAAMLPEVQAAKRKIDKTGVLRLTAHYLRAHQYVFGESIERAHNNFNPASALAVLGLLNGFLLTTTYKGLVVVVSQNVNEYLGYSEVDLLGTNILNITHEDDRHILREQLMPPAHMLGANGDLLFSREPNGREKVAEALSKEKRQFIVRLKKHGLRTEPCRYVTCHVEGTFRKADGACKGYTRCCQSIRRVRARGENPYCSGNDVVFIGVVRPTVETFLNESKLEEFKMEYRTRHSIDGEIIECEQRISLVTGYMTHEVRGINAMNFMHRDDVRWVIIALREMYDQHRLYGESCYRLMAKNGQFIYMKTRGHLDVDPNTRSATSFVCTNTVVDEEEGKHLIKLMKKKFSVLVNNGNNVSFDDDDFQNEEDNKTLPVEDPKQLQNVILHLVTDLPCPSSQYPDNTPPNDDSPCRLAIIPPRREKIISAIEKMYTLFKSFLLKPRGFRRENTNNSVTCTVVSEDNLFSPLAEYNNQQLPNEPHQYSLHNNSNELVLPETEVLHNELVAFKEICPQRPPNQIFENEIDLASTYDNSCAAGLYGIQYVTQPSTSEKPSLISCSTITNANNVIGGAIKKVPNVKYKTATSTKSSKNKKKNTLNEHLCKSIDSSSPEFSNPGPSKSGVKRTKDFGDQESDLITKKKTSESQLTSEDEALCLPSDQNLLDLESFFDEAILDSEIESAIKELEESIHPNFPDLLVSSEVQDILNQIEKH